jgi:hypothetical protein
MTIANQQFRRALGMAALSVALLVQTSPVNAATRSAPAGSGGQYRDYLTPQGSANATGIGSDQCGKALPARVGRWFCFSGAGTQAPPEPVTVAPNETVYCNVSGCYDRYNDFQADFASTTGAWGWGTTQLGSLFFYVNWSLQGAQTTSKPVQYRNSVPTRAVIFTGDLINAAPGAAGTQVAGAFSLFGAGDIPASTTKSWTPNGYKSYDTRNIDHSQVHQFSWEYGAYPGYWYAWVKSICSADQERDGIYKFHSAAANQLPASPYGGGHRN